MRLMNKPCRVCVREKDSNSGRVSYGQVARWRTPMFGNVSNPVGQETGGSPALPELIRSPQDKDTVRAPLGYRGSSLTRKRTPRGPYRRPMPRVLRGS